MTDPCEEPKAGTQPDGGTVDVRHDACGVTVTINLRCGCGEGKGGFVLPPVEAPPSDIVPVGPPTPDIPRDPVMRDAAGEWFAFRMSMNGIRPWADQYRWSDKFSVAAGFDVRTLHVWTPAEQSKTSKLYRGFGLAKLNGLDEMVVSLSGTGSGVARDVTETTPWSAAITASISPPNSFGAKVTATVKFTSATAAGRKHRVVVMPLRPKSGGTTQWSAYQTQGNSGAVETGPIDPAAVTVAIPAPVVSGAEYAVFVVQSDRDIFDGKMTAEPVSPAVVLAVP